MEKTVYLLGNGKSREKYNVLDYKAMQNKGIVVGCNAFYRDFTPDYLFAIDAGIIHEILDSGYIGECYFTHNSWNLLPADSYEALKHGLDGNEIETYRRFDDRYFVYISGLDEDCSSEERYILWVRKNMEHRIRNIGVEAVGWSTGTSALYAICRDLAPKRVELIGFDHKSDDYDNIYAGSAHYFKENSKLHDGFVWNDEKRGIPQGNLSNKSWKDVHHSWTEQIEACRKKFSHIEIK
ncbi:MAG: hypothetical protein MK035_04265 [Dehalococcoidia bacterium]|nr:hypothetical protein [Dehalococcoidia bacterium]